MADSQPLPNRGSSRASWVRARKARPQVTLGRRRRRRLGSVRGVARKRLRRRLLQAQAAGADWREGACELGRAAAPRKPKAAEPSPAPAAPPAPAPAPAPAPGPDPDPLAAATALARRLTLPIPDPRAVGPGRAVLVLPLERAFTFSGVCRLTCIYGQVQVFGLTIGPGHAHDLFSAYTHSRLSINAVHYFVANQSQREMRKDLRAALRPYVKRGDRNWVIENFSLLCSVVLLERLENPTVNFIMSHPGLSTVFIQETESSQAKVRMMLALKDVGIREDKKKNGLSLSESALAALEGLVSLCCEEISSCPAILVCGPQDVGKSTFNRYLINQLLNSLPCVDYLECDLGQTEFTPPGCISLLNVTEPILGPPFTHQRTPQKMVYFGKPSCHDSIEAYVEAVKYVFSAYRREAPLVINTMGWAKDNGLLLLIDLIRILAPSHVVQFSTHRTQYVPELTASYVDSMDGLYTRSTATRRNRGYFLPEFADLELEEERTGPPVTASHALVPVRSSFMFRRNSRNRETFGRVLRELAVLGYLGLLQPPAPQPLRPLQGMIPYQVPFNAVALRVMHSDVAPTHIMYAVNASWLGLCRMVDDVRGYSQGPVLLAQNPLCDCLGFGICRGVDMEKRLYHILTPMAPEQLRTVNCLLLGAVSIPSCVLKNQRGPEGTIPYITVDYNYKLPGASEKIGAREMEGADDEKQRLRPRLRKRQ